MDANSVCGISAVIWIGRPCSGTAKETARPERSCQKEEDKLKHTRVGLPEDKYLQRIGEIAYAASYIEWTLLGDIPRLQDRLPDDFCLEKLESKTTGSIAKAAQEAAKQCQDGEVRAYLEVMGKALSTMAEIRNDVLHARPATYDTTSGTQRLFRAKVDTTRKPPASASGSTRSGLMNRWIGLIKHLMISRLSVHRLRSRFSVYIPAECGKCIGLQSE